ncbi:MAG: S16 family serine protease [Myxococcota bacterium]
MRFILALLLVVGSACGSTGIQRREVAVDFLWVRGIGPGATGGTSPAVVSIEPNPTDRVRVGVLEGSALQLGDQWRASVWLAAFQASMALNRPLSDWLLWVEAEKHGDRVDGPSAGGLLTAAMLAGMTGAKADPDFTMTGTINPDGSIGPVGGIPQKFRGAIAAGKHHLGYPLGQHLSTDVESGQDVDVRGLASGGITIEEVPDVETAYRLMTGKTLKRPTPVDAKKMSIPKRVEDALRAQAEVWLGNAAGTFQDYQSLRLDDPLLAATWADIDSRFGVARATLEKNDVGAAYNLAAALFVDADSALVYGKLLQLVRDTKYEDADRYAQSVIDGVDMRLQETTQLLKSELAKSANDLMTLIDAFEALGAAIRHFGAGVIHRGDAAPRVAEIIAGVRTGAVKMTPELQGELLSKLHEPLISVSHANVSNFMATQNLQFRPEPDPKAKLVAQAAVDRLGDWLSLAARANLSYFETTVLAPMADNAKITHAEARDTFNDSEYQLIKDESRAMAEMILEQHLGSGTQSLSLVKLATALNTYVDASFLIAKYYSLEAELGPTGAVEKVGRDEALGRMLELAEVKARVFAARAEEVGGEIPVAAAKAYQIGVAFSAMGTPAFRIAALEQFWRASMFSQLAVMLRR